MESQGFSMLVSTIELRRPKNGRLFCHEEGHQERWEKVMNNTLYEKKCKRLKVRSSEFLEERGKILRGEKPLVCRLLNASDSQINVGATGYGLGRKRDLRKR